MKLMSDILFKADAKYEEDFAAYQKQKDIDKRHGQASIFDLLGDDLDPVPNAALADRIVKLKQSILEQAQDGHLNWEFDELLYALTENGWFAQFSEKDFRAACKELYAEGQIERISGGRGWSRGTEFTIRLA